MTIKVGVGYLLPAGLNGDVYIPALRQFEIAAHNTVVSYGRWSSIRRGRFSVENQAVKEIQMAGGGKSEYQAVQSISVYSSPQWLIAFFMIAIPTSTLPFFVGFIMGFSVASDIVFGVYALISGLIADIVLRWKFKRALMVWIKPKVPFNVIWILLCLYVITFQPLD